VAQQALPYPVNQLAALKCPLCGELHFDRADRAVDPHEAHECEHCRGLFHSEAPTVSNPIVALLPVSHAAFRKHFPDVPLTPRYPWESDSNW
jgi:predicted RNA-binding Zn-ribbon protein involved in translation (DUF1610 family)